MAGARSLPLRPTGKLVCELSGRVGKTYGSERRPELAAMRTGLVCLTLALLAVALTVPAIAEAYRAPTPAQQSEMERSAVLYHENPHDYVPGTQVSVTNAKVSTAAPWALATVNLTVDATREPFTDPEIFRPINGTWTDVGPLNDEPASMVPEAVAKDLGVPYLPSNQSGTATSTLGNTPTSGSSGFLHGAIPHSLYVFLAVAALVSWFIGLLCFLSAWLQPPSHFKSIGRSKPAWMAITTLGLIPCLGIIPALIYFSRVYLNLPPKHRKDPTGSPPKPLPRAPSRPAGSRNPTGGTIEHYKALFTGAFLRLPDRAWKEVSDPAQFFRHSVVLVLRRQGVDGRRVGMLATIIRGVLALLVLAYLAAGALFGLIIPNLGNSIAFAITFFAVGIGLALPAEFGHFEHARLRAVRIAMWTVEALIVCFAIVMVIVWGVDGPAHNETIAGITWALAILSMADVTMVYAIWQSDFYDTFRGGGSPRRVLHA